MHHFQSNGKLLITGEYLVLDGALSLALPTIYGQTLSIEENNNQIIEWSSLDHQGNPWFSCNLDLSLSGSPKNEVEATLLHILKTAKALNPDFLKSVQGVKAISVMDFPRDWGLGSSSTLINNIAQWAGINAFDLSNKTLGGSGYDIACAQHNTAILYQLTDGKPTITETKFTPPFRDQIYFIHLNQKQNSREGIKKYRALNKSVNSYISDINTITKGILECTDVAVFKSLIDTHEDITSKAIAMEPIKKRFFNDFEGSIKSLGAWGGDFIMAVGDDQTPQYFSEKGFDTILTFKEMIRL
ncbi:GYDIA family GHMP kinase [Zhouia amylolytica]|uniref:GYDIA family GHMP kinase n=1 Tax=Zhouia amylolytica TaxID=376730 RepID=UPI0020CBADCD|nr:GYDIA family GHMP kinase [Zhouia amylolytica]MCQ0111721.1 GHMP kinase [Zhouia amylolytica]